MVAIFDSHFSKTFGFPSNWFLALDVDVSLFLANELSQLQVLNMRLDGLMQNLESLIRANLDFERFIQSIIKFGCLNCNVQIKHPCLFLSVSSFGVL